MIDLVLVISSKDLLCNVHQKSVDGDSAVPSTSALRASLPYSRRNIPNPPRNQSRHRTPQPTNVFLHGRMSRSSTRRRHSKMRVRIPRMRLRMWTDDGDTTSSRRALTRTNHSLDACEYSSTGTMCGGTLRRHQGRERRPATNVFSSFFGKAVRIVILIATNLQCGDGGCPKSALLPTVRKLGWRRKNQLRSVRGMHIFEGGGKICAKKVIFLETECEGCIFQAW
mmetsp:Transcript_20934/g.47524  ORF Transcript_20934/g.47524 Transcript_20934/m.47524 type:complete len:225 (+) Transcript_20934:43-717(+)